MALIKLANGTVHDPANGIDGEVRDIWIEAGKVVAPPTDPDAVVERVHDLTGLVVMPGGVDMHAHIAGPKVNVARKLRPEDRRDNAPFRRTKLLRSGTLGSTPTTFATGYLYAGLGYTTVFDAAIPPLGARHTHEEFHDTPVIDKGFFVLVGNNHYVMDQLGRGEFDRVRAFCGWLLHATRGYALKVVNPGGVEVWKQGKNGMTGLEDVVPGFGVSPRQIVTAAARVADELNLPHPVHVHCNQLGMPGNWTTTLDTMRAVEGHRAHFTHIQFHSYGGGPDDQGTFRSRVPDLAEWVNAHPSATVDVGQVMFGDTTSMTGDGPLGHFLHRVTGRKWFNGDTECEGGCGIVPIEYKEKSFVHALQWAIGLEWYLLVRDPWKVAMSTDHPNGGSFLAYPEICALLMSRDYRREVLKRLPAKLKDVCTLPELDREYTLQEIAIVTRAGPARMLGLTHKGHLGVGADADVTVYTPGADLRAMFELPRFVFKAGKLVVEKGEIRLAPYGPALVARPAFDAGALPHIRDWFEGAYSLAFDNYAVGSEYLTHGETVVSCGERGA
ncbi:formylmethanofuran dehydrogenase subunit a : Formylmethanofuran dehydrogenase subunit A OS=Pirellula staleyi (strain ATCC 27377 / DSM 6068 / ICPB 4128) GN=Psta_0063 PE=4 SV=1: Amidohydro_3 [Gemmataceae bacterium]|nr:formylmethanofuran dehydrogenase subunit a : Formylmethanofuran dehydrogenase subunit A OS=Pirellula staleyi (strain ATCC 27377 / DSM 6068 / ICPB 4128) GN=Psta_0063 PE=4 SV=1: Amidohydro_3 [Gemmataceae bacterium]VTT98485.1 formylmethanofuran dehydrogenase subunit a : Formylmethanofuran dehydrogenase subunit A OS=Pirellula staleyi (strain ATCC 27377 / DSM 6068 / ICPB 4128) GN=Psta_0063 PE=4 SV=1: Amidohydro_3 [Gemmataceae bacterium]